MATPRALVARQAPSSFTVGPADEVVALRTTWPAAVLGKAFQLRLDGSLAAPAGYKAGKFFVPEAIPVRDIRELHAVWERLAVEGGGIFVRGGLSGARVPTGTRVGRESTFKLRCDHVTRRTCDGHADGHPAGLRDVPRRWLLLDMDKVRNILGLDPRKDPEAVVDFLLGLLPHSVQRCTVSWDWSSSMCIGTPAGQAPATLSAHLRIWLDSPLAHLETRALLERMCEFTWLRLRELGVEPAGDRRLDGVIDWKPAEPQQPLYVAVPYFGQGIKDPFPGGLRRGLREGASEVVRLAELEAELDTAGAPRIPAPARVASKAIAGHQKSSALPAPRRTRPVSLPPSDASADVVPIAAARRLAEAQRARRAGGPDRHLRAGRGIFAARAPLETVRLVRGRVAAGAHDRRWRKWHEAGGVPEGLRDRILFLVGCLVAESMPGAQLTDEAVNGAILEIGRLIIAGDWLEECWVLGRFWSTLVGRAVAAGRSEVELWRGEFKDPRYRVGKERLLRELMVQPEEVTRYGLVSLASDRDRLAAKRQGEGATSLAETQAANLAKAREAERLMSEGSSQCAAAAAVGLHEKQLRRILRAGTAEHAGSAEEARSPSVRGSVRTVRRLVEEEERGKGREDQDSPARSPGAAPAAAAPDAGAKLAETYAALTAAASARGADGAVAVPAPPPDAPSSVQHAYCAALEAVADARRRATVRHRRQHGPAAAARTWYDGLAALPIAEALARVRARRQELLFAQRAELAAVVAGGGERALRNLELRHLGAWAVENRHSARILGPAWTRGRRAASAGSDLAALRGPAPSARWRAATRAAEGLVLLAAEDRTLFLIARAAAAEDEVGREELRILSQAISAMLSRNCTAVAHRTAA
ncbi:hypothetical protein [Belnapia rosea]|uniref:hypothetical protein n=1 Tax=Belnapia rosea TaxID=938405 RepID=UPI0008850C93|nr:hypothetical protein [Belnapia rosea]SDB20268.1 hypothetical protein SAMN02927895_00798 [Belnapia rosea]